MTQEEKSLLLQDLCARLPYGVKIHYHLKRSDEDGVFSFDREHKDIGVLYYEDYSEDAKKDCNYDKEHFSIILCGCYYGEDIKPYLRPMSSMTEEEKKDYELLCDYYMDDKEEKHYFNNFATLDWMNQKHFDYRGLIKLGLALEAHDEMYK